jgi:hypothetical protein
MFDLILPLFSIILVFIFFVILLWRKLKQNLFVELGIIYLGFVVLYTLIPGLGLLYAEYSADINVGMLLEYIDASKADLAFHLWRHFLFAITFAGSYYYFRTNNRIVSTRLNDSSPITIYFLIFLIAFSIAILFLLSAPVNGYLEHYTRYDHLPTSLRKIVSFVIRFKMGFYTILLTILFSNYKQYKLFVFFVVASLCITETIYSHGSRIYSLIILLQCFFLYNYFVKAVTLKFVIVTSLSLMTLYSAIEIIRLQDVETVDVQDSISETGIGIPAELGAVYVPSFQLYNDRNKNTLPPKDWQMFFYDFISPFTFNSDTRWNPMYWYGVNYYPLSEVPPFTIGPIAESAIWGGEVDLFFRGIINGLFFAFIVKWFILRREKFWAVTIYVYCFSFSIITIKYSIFFYLTPLVKELIPTVFITMFIIFLVRGKRDRGTRLLQPVVVNNEIE